MRVCHQRDYPVFGKRNHYYNNNLLQLEKRAIYSIHMTLNKDKQIHFINVLDLRDGLGRQRKKIPHTRDTNSLDRCG